MARKINFDVLPDHVKSGPAEAASGTPLPVRPLLGLDRPLRPAGALGAISQSLGGMTEKVKRADEIEQKLIEGQVVVELDPVLIDPSFVVDRMDPTDEQNAEFRELIRAHGQAVPILVRPDLSRPGRYQVAFGHRRLRAARELGIKIRAVVRTLTDDELVIAQGQENSGRTDLTFIERARFAARLEARNFSRDIIMAALNVDKAALSRLISVATRVPMEVIEAVGPAPSFGRVRWQELMDLLDRREIRERSITVVETAGFSQLTSDKRFEALMTALKQKAVRNGPIAWTANDGTHAAKVLRNGRKLTLTFDDRVAPNFGEFVKEKLQRLYDDYKGGVEPT